MKSVIEAVNYISSKKIMHRDIKPENLMFSDKDNFQLKVLIL